MTHRTKFIIVWTFVIGFCAAFWAGVALAVGRVM